MSVTEVPQESEESGFERGGILRSTVARKCRDFYIQRLKRTEVMQRRWTVCSPMEIVTESEDSEGPVSSDPEPGPDDLQSRQSVLTGHSSSPSGSEKGNSPPPLRKWKSTFDLAMDNLRREISSLVAQDNDLFKQLLSLNDSIAELRDQQRRSLELFRLEDDDFSDCSRSPSLDSLSDPDTVTTASPSSTLSSSCSSSHHHHSCRSLLRDNKTKNRHFQRGEVNTLCTRCGINGKLTTAPFYKRCVPFHNDWRRDDFNSYDSGIHLHGSDSEREVFV